MQELRDVFELFYSDELVNSYETMVCGNDLCETMGLMLDLSEAVNELHVKRFAELEKYKIAYNNRVRRDKRKE